MGLSSSEGHASSSRSVFAALFIALSMFGAPIASADTASVWERLFGRGSSEASKDNAEGPVVSVARPRVERFAEYIELTGNAASVNTVKLVARVEGFLDNIYFLDGSLAKKGDLLFKIQQDQYKATLERAEAQVRATQAAITYAHTEVARYSQLQKKGAATQVTVDDWKYQAAKSESDNASAQAQVVIAKLNLSYTEMRAPFDGQMGKHLVDVGNLVGAGQQTLLSEILQLDPIYVVLNLSEQEVLQIRQSLGGRRLSYAELVKVPMEVGLEGSGEFPLHATVEYVAPAVDPQMGTLLVRGIMPNREHTLLPGVFVRVRLPRGNVLPQALLVPDRVIQADQGGRYLLVLNQDDIVEQRYAQLGELSGTLRVIASGLNAQDRVVISDFWRAVPGTKISPKLVAIDEPRRSVNH